jgi:hypothetical protein
MPAIAGNEEGRMKNEETAGRRCRFHADVSSFIIFHSSFAFHPATGTVRCAVRCPALSRPPPDSRPNRWPPEGLRQRGTSQRDVPTGKET